MAFITTTLALVATRAVGGLITNLSDRFFPYEKSKTYKQIEHSAAVNAINQQKQAEINRRLQEELTERNIKSQKEIAYFTVMAQRQTSLLLAKQSTASSIRNMFIQDAIRNFPLNISPMILLENNNIDISSLFGEESNNNISIVDQLLAPKPISIFISPIHIDSCVVGKERIVAQVWDSMSIDVETLFVNEYARHSERPVIFYPAAWNTNVKSGLHTAEQLHYFLKDLPTLVIEPRFDGKQLKIMISCWGLGYSSRTHFRQELSLGIDWAKVITDTAYQRSKANVEFFATIKDKTKQMEDRIVACQHNIEAYDKLNLGSENGHDSVGKLCDYSKLFHLEPSDTKMLSDTISECLKLSVAAITDTHHILASGVEPLLPSLIKKEYFKGHVDNELIKQFSKMFAQTYAKLDSELKNSTEEQCLKRLEAYNTERQLSLLQMEYDNNTHVDTNDNNWEIRDIIIQYCKLKRWTDIRNTNVRDFSKVFAFYLSHMDDNDSEFNAILSHCLDSNSTNALNVQISKNKFNG